MTKLKSAEYWATQGNTNISTIKLIKSIQKNAIEAALEVTAGIVVDRYETRTGEAIDKQSITSLINHPNLKL